VCCRRHRAIRIRWCCWWRCSSGCRGLGPAATAAIFIIMAKKADPKSVQHTAPTTGGQGQMLWSRTWPARY
jgi:hypothetical protein